MLITANQKYDIIPLYLAKIPLRCYLANKISEEANIAEA